MDLGILELVSKAVLDRIPMLSIYGDSLIFRCEVTLSKIELLTFFRENSFRLSI